jgi:hypothetical protein
MLSSPCICLFIFVHAVYFVSLRYHDGYIAQNLDAATIHMQKLFYPKWWLDATDFWKNKPNTGDGVILFGPNLSETEYIASPKTIFLMVLSAVISSVLTLFLLACYMRYNNRKRRGLIGASRHDYIAINL